MNIDHIVSTNQANHCLITHRHSAASAQLPKSRLRVHINIDRLDSINRVDPVISIRLRRLLIDSTDFKV